MKSLQEGQWIPVSLAGLGCASTLGAEVTKTLFTDTLGNTRGGWLSHLYRKGTGFGRKLRSLLACYTPSIIQGKKRLIWIPMEPNGSESVLVLSLRALQEEAPRPARRVGCSLGWAEQSPVRLFQPLFWLRSDKSATNMMIKISRLLTPQLILNHSQVIEIHLLLICRQDMASLKAFRRRNGDFLFILHSSLLGVGNKNVCVWLLEVTVILLLISGFLFS